MNRSKKRFKIKPTGVQIRKPTNKYRSEKMTTIEIHLYGRLRRLAEKSGPTDDSVLNIEWKENETLEELVEQRLNLTFDQIGEIFINYTPITEYDIEIPENARIGLFEKGMYLLCGGQHMKGHGFITSKKKNAKMNYWQEEQEV